MTRPSLRSLRPGLVGEVRVGAGEELGAAVTDAIDPASIHAVLFDVIGTLVDDAGGVRTAVRAELTDADAADALAADWLQRFNSQRSAVAAGDRDWTAAGPLRREALDAAVSAAGVELPPDALDRLATVGSRLDPWPDTARGLDALAPLVAVFGLTNAAPAEVAAISARGRLRWHTVLSTEPAQTYKPGAGAYDYAIGALALDPSRTLFVAAHGWDLAAARPHGFATAFLQRPGADEPAPDDVDIRLDSLDDLVTLLRDGRTQRAADG